MHAYIHTFTYRQLMFISPLVSCCYGVDERNKLSTVAQLFDAFSY